MEFIHQYEKGKFLTRRFIRDYFLAICAFIALIIFAVYYQWFLEPKQTAAADGPTLLGYFDSVGTLNANDVAVAGQYAYLATENNSGSAPEFYILDVSTPQNPRLVGSLDVGTTINKIAVSGNYAYLATRKETKELIIIDISNKSSPREIGSLNTPGNANGLSLFIENKLVYFGTNNNTDTGGREFYIINAVNPVSPVTLGSFEIGSAVNDIVVNAGRAYLATNHDSREIVVLDVITPNAITQVGSYDFEGSLDANIIDYRSGKIYVVTDNGGTRSDFYIFSVGISPAISLIGAMDLQSNNKSLTIVDKLVYIGSNDDVANTKIVSVRDPAHPELKATFNAESNVSGTASLDGKYLYLATSHNTKEFQVIEPKVVLPPNILIIMTDDQRWDTIQYMPAVMQRLVGEGVKFTNSFVTTSVCCPSRASFLTGQYAHNTGIHGNRPPEGGATLFNSSSTLATWLHGVGYTTGLIGKYMNSNDLYAPAIPAGWDTWRTFVEDTDLYYNYTLNENGIFVSYGSTTADYSTDVLRNMALEYINKNAQRPFFLLFTPFAPHEGPPRTAQPAPRHKGMFANIPLWRPPNYNEADVSDKPLWVQAVAASPYNTPEQLAIYDQLRKDQLETLLAVDEAIGAILDIIKTLDLTNDTVVIFTSDNGYMWGEHWWWLKEAVYEESMRIPLVIRYPRIVTSAREESGLVANIDLAPTLAELAGVTIPPETDGVSIVNILKGVASSVRNDFLIEHWIGLFNIVPPYTSVRTSDWKYVKIDGKNFFGPYTFEELYNFTVDPYELNNLLITDPQNSLVQQKASELRARLEQLRAE